ncbi:NRDE family protein [Bacillus sp. JJ1764]|uniref:NRDE family protein n=1 Tax=Bacillus sp. JJ1764 TaxID=3122964 RepID=UPI00300053BA
MCLILFAYKVHPIYKLLVAANRDEFLQRPTLSAHYWEDHPEILAGRDLEKLGTWMGVTRYGRMAALTNYRNPNESLKGKRSRGELVANSLHYAGQLDDYLEKVKKEGHFYPGYNLLVGDVNELYYYSNVGLTLEKLEPGIYGVSNHLLNTEWPKVKKGKEGLLKILSENPDNLVERLLGLLEDSDPVPDELLPKTGVTLEWERVLSPLFIKSENYGTRSSTVLLMSDQEVQYVERVFVEGHVSERDFHFCIQSM